MSNRLRTVGAVIFLAPIVLISVFYLVCIVYSPFCIAAPLVGALASPAFIVGAVVFILGAFGSRKQEESLAHGLEGHSYSTTAKPTRNEPSSATEVQQMQEYGIAFDGERYSFEGYRYEKLVDAINYAKRHSGQIP